MKSGVKISLSMEREISMNFVISIFSNCVGSYGTRQVGALLFFIALLLLTPALAQAQTVTNNLAWSITNPGSPQPATDFRIEKNIGGTWTALATVPSTQLTYADAGNAPGLYTYRVIPMRDGFDGTPSNSTICGAVPPDTTISLTCSAVVIP